MNAFPRLGIGGIASAFVASLTAASFLPSRELVEAQLANVPDVAMVVATIDGKDEAIRSYGAELDEGSRFEIGSITKTFTATLFADMILRHEVSADDPIERYLPPHTVVPTFEGRHITLLDLATQSSGLPRMPTNFTPSNPADPYADYDDEKLIAFLRTYALRRAPASAFEYSNLGVGLLGNLLGRRLGIGYAAAIEKRIFEPLGMTHTTIPAPNRPVATAVGHDADGDPTTNWTLAALAGAGAIVSTPRDMLRYARANLDPQRGPLAAAMRLAQTPLRAADGGSRIGYAWYTQPDGIVWHNGGTAGFRSFLGLDPAHDRAIVALANGYVPSVDALAFHALDDRLPVPVAPPPDAPLDPTVARTVLGRYRFRDGSTAVVTRDARGLIVTFDMPTFRARLHPRGADRFVIVEPAISVSFAGNGLRAMTVAQPGQPPDVGERVP